MKMKTAMCFTKSKARGATRKWHSNGGFTLMELLCTIVILLLVSAMVLTGVQLGLRVFERSVAFSQAQVLASTLKTTVSDELRYAGTVQISGGTVGFFSQNYGESGFEGFSSDGAGQVLLGEHKLLPSKSYPYGIRAQVKITAYDDRSRIFTVTVTVRDRKNTTVLDEIEFEVKQLNAQDVQMG